MKKKEVVLEYPKSINANIKIHRITGRLGRNKLENPKISKEEENIRLLEEVESIGC